MQIRKTTLEDLDWDALRDALSWSAHSPLGREALKALGFLASKAEIDQEYDRIAEALELLQQDARPSLHDLFDIGQELGAARRGAAVPGIGLLNVASICRTIAATRQWTQAIPHAFAAVRTLVGAPADPRPLLQAIERAIDTNGELRDDASAELKSLRDRALVLHDGITQELERMLVKLDDQGLLSDRFVSLRNDRFVIPVKASAQHDVGGIVHDASHSGFTVFVEPEAIIERGNKLKILRVRILEEEQRILRELSEAVSAMADDITAAVRAATSLDMLFAKADFARKLEAERPEIVDPKTPLMLERVRHPLLMLQKQNVVANDILFSASERCLVLTGPNTGGKTAALKTVGTISLMGRAGLFIPARGGSRLPLYEGIYSVIGDNQSLSRALSTFSSHIVEVRELLDAVTRAHQNGDALILLDELCADTDPRLGAALGQAILEALVERSAWVVLTTHYFDLAALAMKDGRFANASFGFDPERLVPTYRLQRGMPGASSPFEIALTLGLDSGVVERARAIVPSVGGGLDELTRRVEGRLVEVDALKQALEVEKREIDKDRAVTQEERRLAALERKEAEERALAMLGDDLKKAQAQVKEAVRRLQDGLLSKPTREAAREMTTRDAMKLVEDVRGELADAQSVVQKHAPPAPAAADPGGIRVGDLVTAQSLARDAVGEVLAIDAAKHEVTVALGKLRMRLPMSELIPSHKQRGVSARAPARAASAVREARRGPRGSDEAPSEGQLVQGNKLDVRGVRVEDALRAIDRALDAALKESTPELVILHGHGTGALKNAIREYLSFSHYVRSYRPGRANEGEDSVTVVEL
ncbi:MAG: Smr/MutS family protein [Deltaproteobacteria bacterium]|nr:Smr/MutS family protein [Deltaproteobacteria bacterium]